MQIASVRSFRGVTIISLFLGLAWLAGTDLKAASVRDFGAKGDGLCDDTGALQRAIDRTRAGTLRFPAGTYRISKTLNLQSNVTYDGGGHAVLTGTNGDFLLQLPWDATSVVVKGLTLDGGGLTFQGGLVNNIHITENTFRNLTGHSENWTIRNAIFSGATIRHSSIDHNTFKNLLVKGVTRWDNTVKSIDDTNGGMVIYGLDSTSIDHNVFDHVGQGIKVCFSQPFPTRNVYIGYNVMTHIHRMGMELQGAVGCGGKNSFSGDNTFNLVIEFNQMTQWDDFYWNSTGISAADAAPDGANGVIVRYNLIEGGVASYSGPYGYGIEAAGLGLDVYGNVIAGSYGQSIGVGSKSINAKVRDNYTCALKPGAELIIGAEDGPSPGATYMNNQKAKACPSPLPRPGARMPVQ